MSDIKETLACLIIDDPLLRPKYGCLDYSLLLKEMETHNFFTEIAFIPWNYKRNSHRTVTLFKENENRLGVCVHGCNHTGNEFGQGTYKELSELAATALFRMDKFSKITGLKYDPVMVFPQGKFSATAMKALKDQGFFAACNTTLKATDNNQLLSEEYQFAVTKMYHNFPLFYRRYPIDKEMFKEDIENGRPILIVEHHGAFQNGYKKITDLVDWINSLDNIRWTSLGNIAERYLGEKNKNCLLPTNKSRSTLSQNCKILCRRMLSEVRDNYVQKYPKICKLYNDIKGHNG